MKLSRPEPNAPIFKTTGRDSLVVKAGTVFGEHTFAEDTPVPLHLNAAGEPGYIPGADYAVNFDGNALSVTRMDAITEVDTLLGGFHYAPGGNATARSGGDDIPAINPYSLWDIGFRPACPDPRGMVLVEAAGLRFWCDIYLTGVNHMAEGTSRFGATIADGQDLPLSTNSEDGDPVERFDYPTAQAAIAAHGKQLLGAEEFFTATYGVTERTAPGHDPKVTGLDAPRTSRFGLMQATGNLWVWGNDGDPDDPPPSLFGGSWLYNLDSWPGISSGSLGARGRSDHLSLE